MLPRPRNERLVVVPCISTRWMSPAVRRAVPHPSTGTACWCLGLALSAVRKSLVVHPLGYPARNPVNGMHVCTC